MVKLPRAPVNRIVRNAGAERVSKEAYQELARLLEEHGEEISIEAVRITKHARRKTVKKEDILEAMAPATIGHADRKKVKCPYCNEVYDYSIKYNFAQGPVASLGRGIVSFFGDSHKNPKNFSIIRRGEGKENYSVKCPSCGRLFEFDV
jgi:histone H3/H4